MVVGHRLLVNGQSSNIRSLCLRYHRNNLIYYGECSVKRCCECFFSLVSLFLEWHKNFSTAQWWCCLRRWLFGWKWRQDLAISRLRFGLLCRHCQCLGDDCRSQGPCHHGRNPVPATKHLHSRRLLTLQIRKTGQQCIQWKNLNIIFVLSKKPKTYPNPYTKKKKICVWSKNRVPLNTRPTISCSSSRFVHSSDKKLPLD